jgi:hypothetical protein
MKNFIISTKNYDYSTFYVELDFCDERHRMFFGEIA